MLHQNEEPDRPATCECGKEGCSAKDLLEHRVRTLEDGAGERYVNVTDVTKLLALLLKYQQDSVTGVPIPVDMIARVDGMLAGQAMFEDWAKNLIQSNVTHIPAAIEVPDSVPTEWLTGGAAGAA